jgi:hypothetical protein
MLFAEEGSPVVRMPTLAVKKRGRDAAPEFMLWREMQANRRGECVLWQPAHAKR